MNTVEVYAVDEGEKVILIGSKVIYYEESIEVQPLEICVGEFPVDVMSIVDDTNNGEDKYLVFEMWGFKIINFYGLIWVKTIFFIV